MYRCTDCHTEYIELPNYCDCGNNTFEEIKEETLEEVSSSYINIPKRKPTPEELEELKNEEIEKKKSIIAGIIIAILCITVLFFPLPTKKKKEIKPKDATQTKIELPSVSSYWDNTVPSKYKSKDPIANLPLLNSKFKTISSELRKYLVDIGRDFDRKWDKSIVNGAGECKVQFTLDKEGNLSSKRIVSKSYNDSFDNSVLFVLSKINSFPIPPDEYKGERIYITFKINKKGDSQVIYPME